MVASYIGIAPMMTVYVYLGSISHDITAAFSAHEGNIWHEVIYMVLIAVTSVALVIVVTWIAKRELKKAMAQLDAEEAQQATGIDASIEGESNSVIELHELHQDIAIEDQQEEEGRQEGKSNKVEIEKTRERQDESLREQQTEEEEEELEVEGSYEMESANLYEAGTGINSKLPFSVKTTKNNSVTSVPLLGSGSNSNTNSNFPFEEKKFSGSNPDVAAEGMH